MKLLSVVNISKAKEAVFFTSSMPFLTANQQHLTLKVHQVYSGYDSKW